MPSYPRKHNTNFKYAWSLHNTEGNGKGTKRGENTLEQCQIWTSVPYTEFKLHSLI